MSDDIFTDEAILASWRRNSAPWIAAVRNAEIESRRLVTDRAVLDTVLARRPRTAIDLGCGEGWLALALARHGIAVTGVDAVPELVESARRSGLDDCRPLSYEAIAAGQLDCRADVVVCNFSLLGKESVDGLMRAVPALLEPAGALVVQTLHPYVACGELPYADGWRIGSWAGFSDAFHDSPPWYFRTLESWIALFEASGLALRALREPLHPYTGKPASVLFVAQARVR